MQWLKTYSNQIHQGLNLMIGLPALLIAIGCTEVGPQLNCASVPWLTPEYAIWFALAGTVVKFVINFNRDGVVGTFTGTQLPVVNRSKSTGKFK